jgi:ABC-type dipeptide/oligopeptide/nickel transport system permease component
MTAVLGALRRVGVALFTLWGAVTVMFFVVRALPGDPAAVLAGPSASAADLAHLRHQLGLDQPLLSQYGHYLAGALAGDFGQSSELFEPAMKVVLGHLGASLELTLAATLLALVVGLPAGLVAGWHAGRPVDRLISSTVLAGQSVPTFWVGIMLILLLARLARVLPSSGDGGPQYLILPAVTLALPFIGLVARLTRSSVAEVSGEAFVTTARAKGLTGRQVLTGHVLKNSLIPVASVVALQIGTLLGGAVVVENVFAWPGLGTTIVDAVTNRDYSVMQAAVFVIAFIVVLLNLLADLLSVWLDPRIRLGAKA